jgi:hypothetical protein
MPVTRPSSAPDAAGPDPKAALYAHVYDPVTRAWSDALGRSPEVARLLDGVTADNLLDSLDAFNDLFRRLVDDSLAGLPARAALIDSVGTYREHVLWADHLAPAADAGAEALGASIAGKLRRNVSLAVVEALICLESAYQFCRDKLGLTGEPIADTLRRSRQLYRSLAVLHDEQEKVRLMFLTEIDGHLRYPDHDYADVLSGRLRIGADKFVVAGPRDEPRLRFLASRVSDVALDSPVYRCPAHRLPAGGATEAASVNDALWDLLIEVYRRAGRFAG